MTDHVLIRYHEIALKGKNQPVFMGLLASNLRRALAGFPGAAVRRGQGQFLVSFPHEVPRDEVSAALWHVFGIAKYAFAHRAGREMEELQTAVHAALEQESPRFSSFRITASRADKDYPLTSPEINRALGDYVQHLTGARVDLRKADLDIHVDIHRHGADVYFNPLAGPGGLPVGSSGKVAVLLSGGIDSPVAAYRMLKRGCPASFIHFHSFPLVDGSSREKARELVRVLDRYQPSSRLYLVPFADIQRQIIAEAPASYRVVLYRRFMVRVAEALARRDGALALVSGESVGQVASQTLENIASIDSVAQMPVLRPLIGMDKIEIIHQAERIGTFPISIEPDEDCCSLFVPPHPVLHSTPEEADRAERGLDVEKLVRMGVDGAEVMEHKGPR